MATKFSKPPTPPKPRRVAKANKRTAKASRAESSRGDAVRVIRKYSNRRLYDTAASGYITLEELKKLVLDDVSFCVRDAQTDEDLTRATLLQVLLSEETFERPVLSERGLRNMVGFLHGPFGGPMGAYFEQCLPLFLESQRRLRERFGEALTPADLEKIAALQGDMTRHALEQYVFGGVENFLVAQNQMQDGMRRMMQGNVFQIPTAADMQNFFNPLVPRPPNKKE